MWCSRKWSSKWKFNIFLWKESFIYNRIVSSSFIYLSFRVFYDSFTMHNRVVPKKSCRKVYTRASCLKCKYVDANVWLSTLLSVVFSLCTYTYTCMYVSSAQFRWNNLLIQILMKGSTNKIVSSVADVDIVL